MHGKMYYASKKSWGSSRFPHKATKLGLAQNLQRSPPTQAGLLCCALLAKIHLYDCTPIVLLDNFPLVNLPLKAQLAQVLVRWRACRLAPVLQLWLGNGPGRRMSCAPFRLLG